jgi:hypothetical protein
MVGALFDLYPAVMSREAVDKASGNERNDRDSGPLVRTPYESPVKWRCRRKGPSLVEVTVEVTYWIDAPPASITDEDFYDGDTGTISIV